MVRLSGRTGGNPYESAEVDGGGSTEDITSAEKSTDLRIELSAKFRCQ